LTAAFIGQELTFGRGPSLFATEVLGPEKISWNDINDDKVAVTTDAE